MNRSPLQPDSVHSPGGRPLRQARTGAFSVVELLFACTIITIALLLITLSGGRARRASQDAHCIQNLKQVGVALALFASDHRQSILPRLYNAEFNADGDPAYSHWHRQLGRKGYLPAINKAGDNTATYCPAYRPTGPYDQSVENPTRSMHRYGLRNWTIPGVTLNDPDRLLPLSAIEEPADFFVLADSYFVNDDSQGYQISPGNTSWRVHLRHQDRAHALFADGHVEAKGREYFQDLHLRQNYTNRSTPLPFYIWPEQP